MVNAMSEGRARGVVSEEDPEFEEGLELPVEPDAGEPVIPDDDDRVVNVPS